MADPLLDLFEFDDAVEGGWGSYERVSYYAIGGVYARLLTCKPCAVRLQE